MPAWVMTIDNVLKFGNENCKYKYKTKVYIHDVNGDWRKMKNRKNYKKVILLIITSHSADVILRLQFTGCTPVVHGDNSDVPLHEYCLLDVQGAGLFDVVFSGRCDI